MRKLTITNTHGFTAESLLKEEQKMKFPSGLHGRKRDNKIL